jgi:hypothetical protein
VRYDGFPDGNPQQWGFVGELLSHFVLISNNENFAIT